jgi:hypothetical protein
MNGMPAYFEPVRQRAAQRWTQLEQDPELAGPWHQLFKQVQSPRHVLSELLQNADDAGATEASVQIDDQWFIFSHNGEDFTEEHFGSLCRFGYSNKRALHTIGFRGIGFKSTFSIGETVELHTPSLSVAFDQRRFTEPRWIESRSAADRITEIRVAIRDQHRKREIEKNLSEWVASPISLLFFKHIRRIRVGDREIHWGSVGPGPVERTEWMALQSAPDEPFLVVQSEMQEFPSEALDEIRQERMLGDGQELEFPPCKVELVLGAKGRLYVVLPTGVETELPFACNAPFIQDPARLKIKDPDTSPTNRWLLQRLGELAASTMLSWLRSSQSSVAERADAYDLLPDVDRSSNSLEASCATLVEQAVEQGIEARALLLTQEGTLAPAGGAVLVPRQLLGVWPADQTAIHFDNKGRPPLAAEISWTNAAKIIKWQLAERIERAQVLGTLQAKHLPRPATWGKLLKLWAYLAPDLTGWQYGQAKERVRIIPVQGTDVLYAANEIVRLGEKRLLHAEADWAFLAEYLVVLNQNWPRFLGEQRREAETADPSEKREIEFALAVSRSLDLDGASDVSDIVSQVADAFFAEPAKSLAQCVQFAQIAAKLGATIGPAFRFADSELHLRKTNDAVLADPDGRLEAFFDEQWYRSHTLHREYTAKFNSCTAEEWSQWVSSGRSGLLGFAPLVEARLPIYGRDKLKAECARRGVSEGIYLPYVTAQFRIEDWDFEPGHWRRWTDMAKQDQGLWAPIVDRVIAQPSPFWSKAKSARAVQFATTGNSRAITQQELLPTWALKLRELPCLRDTKGFVRRPSDLLRRTPQTESLLDVEPFVDGFIDNEATRPLLDLLGVRSAPTGPDGLLARLRALSASANPPAREVDKWYRRLDSMIDHCSTSDFSKIKAALLDESIVLTQSSGWARGSGVFLASDDSDVPGMAVIREAVSDLTLWRKIGIADRPTADLALEWLKTLRSGAVLSQEDARRVRPLLGKYPVRVWGECGHWLNLSGEWVPVDTLECTLSMQSLVAWKHLHEGVKQATADLQQVPADVSAAIPFSALPTLAERIEERFHGAVATGVAAERQPWLNQLGVELQRIEVDDAGEQERIRSIAAALASALWTIVPGLEIIPYIDGTPAGVPRRADVVWLDGIVYAEDRPFAKLARSVAQELGREFRRADIADAIKVCMGRPSQFISEYMEENFKLGPRVESARHAEVAPPVPQGDSGHLANKAADIGAPPEESGAQVPVNSGVVVPQEDEAQPAGEPQDGEAQRPEIEPQSPSPKPQPHARPPKPPIIERFAFARGYCRDGSERFFHSDGSWIAKAAEMNHLWERRAADGHLLACYWPKDHCLDLEPIQMEAEVWGLLDRSPELYSIILADAEGKPIEISGVRLRQMREARELELFPASYRLARRAQ